MEVDETVSLLESLREDRIGSPVVDLDLAMRTGRKRRHRRRMAATGGSVLAVVAVVTAVPVAIHAVHRKGPTGIVAAPSVGTTSAAAAAPSTPAEPTSLDCVEARLPVPKAGQEGLVTGADPSGRFLVGRVYSGGHPTQVAIWDNGKPNTFTIQGGDAQLEDINSEGVAVGDSFVSDTKQAGWIYADGKLSRLPGTEGSAPRAISEQGTIAGTETTADNHGYPIVWHSATSNPVRLPLPPGSNLGGSVADVDSDGTIVGTVLEPAPEGIHDLLSRGVVWRPDGTVELLPLPTDLVAGVNGLEIHSIRNGVITAAATVTTDQSKSLTPVTYDLSTGAFTLPPKAGVWIGAGNAKGGIAGSIGTAPALYTPSTGVIRLPTLVNNTAATPGGAARFIGLAATISDSGLIIGGQDVDENGVITAVVWTCH